ncbi:MAG TPA: LuxR C-terminal-related transcriptional regulator [Anaerolineales bacterium]|nr:LuxR C-terminal-related transcriptional regulator [Anaerolineales bacterium]HRQ92667.1 LuxR C-terminal-related transcriptional regulator [Anaerolineales bacterium]
MKASKPLLSAKLIPPVRAKGLVERPGLASRLQAAALANCLTLISAPAGAGKTTAALALTENLEGTDVVWLSLDAGDQDLDLDAFIHLLVEALRQHHPAFGQHTLAQLQMQGSSSALQLASTLTSELLTSIQQPLLVVLDDLHRIDGQAVYALLDQILEHLPEPLHIVITTRHDPPLRLAQLRLRGQLAEFRQTQLQMNSDEVAQVVRAVCGYQLPPNELAVVNERTQGWVAGIKLVALWLGQLESSERAGRVQQLAATQRLLFDYLVEEVLQQATAATRDFLLQTSLLDELTPEACDALTGRRDSATLLRQLYHQNYFLTFIEGSHYTETYRYHPLFAEFLQKELLRQEWDLTQLHRRAAAASAQPEHRIEHWLAASAWEEAVLAIIELGKSQCERNYITPQMMGYLAQLPKDAHHHYWLTLIEANHARQEGMQQKSISLSLAALPYAEAARDTLGVLEGVWNLFFFHQSELWHTTVEEVMATHQQLSPARQAHYYIGRAWEHLNAYEWPETEVHFDHYLDATYRSPGPDAYYAASQHIGPQFLFVTSGVAKINAIDAQSLKLAGEGNDMLQVGSLIRQGWIAFLQCDLERAQGLCQRSAALVRRVGQLAYMELMLDFLQFNILFAHAKYEELQALVREKEVQLYATETHRESLPAYVFSLWRSEWAQDCVRADTVNRLLSILDSNEWAITCCQPLLLGWQAFTQGRHIEAEHQLAEAAARSRRNRWVGAWGNAELDLALFYLRSQEPAKALTVWSQAAAGMRRRNMPGEALLCGRLLIPLLVLARQEGVEAEIATAALAAFEIASQPRAVRLPHSGETLTPREVEVLQLLVQGATNQDIADALFITVRTVKAHVSNILAKLGVASRAEAIARCHQLALLS